MGGSYYILAENPPIIIVVVVVPEGVNYINIFYNNQYAVQSVKVRKCQILFAPYLSLLLLFALLAIFIAALIRDRIRPTNPMEESCQIRSDIYFIISNRLPDWMVYILYQIDVASESSEQRTLK